MIYRERADATLINELSNMPENARGLSRYKNYGKMEWSDALQGLVGLTNGEDAFIILEPEEDRVWAITTICGPTCRGRKALDFGLEAKEYMRPYADTIFGPVPNSLKNAAWFYRQLGGKPVEVFETENFVYTAPEGETLYRVDM